MLRLTQECSVRWSRITKPLLWLKAAAAPQVVWESLTNPWPITAMRLPCRSVYSRLTQNTRRTKAMQQLRTFMAYSRIADELLANGDAAGSLLINRQGLTMLSPLAAADRRDAVLQMHLVAAVAS